MTNFLTFLLQETPPAPKNVKNQERFAALTRRRGKNFSYIDPLTTPLNFRLIDTKLLSCAIERAKSQKTNSSRLFLHELFFVIETVF